MTLPPDIASVLRSELAGHYDHYDPPLPLWERGAEELDRAAAESAARLQQRLTPSRVRELIEQLRAGARDPSNELVRAIEHWTRTAWSGDLEWPAMRRLLERIASALESMSPGRDAPYVPPASTAIPEPFREALAEMLAAHFRAPVAPDGWPTWLRDELPRRAAAAARQLRERLGEASTKGLAAYLRTASQERFGELVSTMSYHTDRHWRARETDWEACRRILSAIAERLESPP